MNTEQLKQYAPVIVRIGMSLVFLWFGLNQIFDGDSFIGYLPQIAYNLPIQPITIVLLNGIFETIFGMCLLVGILTRISAIILGLHLIGIIASLGYNEIAIRDIGLMIATLSIAVNGNDTCCLANKVTSWKKE